MATGMTGFTADAVLDAMCNNTSFAVTTAYMKLHIGDPGAAGAGNAATETTRKAVSFGTSSGGATANDVAVEWTSISGSEDATHFSLWDASTAGNCLWTGTITANAYTAGDTLSFAVGDIDLTQTIAS